MSSKWISLSEASKKYLIAEEIILLWIESGKFTAFRKEGLQVWLLNAKKLDEYICSRKTSEFDADYVLEIEHYSFYEKERVRIYALSNTLQRQEIENLKEKIAQIEMLKDMISERLDKFVADQKILLLNIAMHIE